MAEDVRKLQNQMAVYEYRLQAAEKLLEKSKDRDKCTHERSHKDDIRRMLDSMTDKMSGDTNLLQYGMSEYEGNNQSFCKLCCIVLRSFELIFLNIFYCYILKGESIPE